MVLWTIFVCPRDGFPLFTGVSGKKSRLAQTPRCPFFTNGIFKEVHGHLQETDSVQPSVFRLFLHQLNTHSDRGDQGRTFEKLQTFGVRTATVCLMY